MRGDKSLSTSPATAGVVCATVAAGFVHQTDLLQLLWPRRIPPCQQRGFSPRGCGNVRHCLRRFCVTTTLAYPNLRLHWGVQVSWPPGLVTLYPVKRFLVLVLLPSPVTNSMRLIRGQKLIIYLWTNMVKSATCQPVLVETLGSDLSQAKNTSCIQGWHLTRCVAFCDVTNICLLGTN